MYTVTSVNEYLRLIEKFDIPENDRLLFRGQGVDKPLLPTIARLNPHLNTTIIEKEMLEELKRRSSFYLNQPNISDWDLLVYAQHFSLKTRLLDWTSNPLVALWFACRDISGQDGFVYVLKANKSFEVDHKRKSAESPFTNTKTRIYKPKLNNQRIISQFGWFTAHKFSRKSGKFVPLESNVDMKHLIVKVKVPSKIHEVILQKISRLGVNNHTIFPDIEGLCRHLNWKYKGKI